MTTPITMQKALDVLLLMNTAITNLRLYPPTSAIITNTVDRLLDRLQVYYADEPSLILAESEKNLLIGGDPLNKKDQERPQVAALATLFMSFNIKSITIHMGIDRRELLSFMEMMAKRPETVQMEGGLRLAVRELALQHIRLDEKVYVAKNGDQQLIASLEITDDQILQYLLATQEGETVNPEQLKDMARDPNWVTRIFQSGMQQTSEQRTQVPLEQLSMNLVFMLRMLDGAMEPGAAGRFVDLVGRTVAGMDAEFISNVLAQDMDGLFGGRLFPGIVANLDSPKMGDVEDTLRRLSRDNLLGAFARALEKLTGTEEWQRLRREHEEQQKTLLREEAARLKEGREAVLDGTSLETIPEAILHSYGAGDGKQGDEILERLFAGLESTDGEVRRHASEALSHVITEMASRGMLRPLRDRIPRLVAWLRQEETATKAYVDMARQAAGLVEQWIRSWDLAAGLPVLEFFHAIQSGALEKNDTIESLALDMVDRLSADDLLDLLLTELETNEHQQRKEAIACLAHLGKAVERLLAILRSSNDTDERVRVLNAIRMIGTPAASIVLRDVKPDGIWFYQRNLVRLLGQIGHGDHSRALEDLLAHEDSRVRKEVVESIYKIGGPERGDILLNALPAQENSLQIQIIGMLGNLRFQPAVEPLVAMLKSKPLIAGSRDDLEKAICSALGAIGKEEALPTLKSISRQIDMFSLRPYSAAVKTAAGKAVAEIRRRRADR